MQCLAGRGWPAFAVLHTRSVCRRAPLNDAMAGQTQSDAFRRRRLPPGIRNLQPHLAVPGCGSRRSDDRIGNALRQDELKRRLTACAKVLVRSSLGGFYSF